jgi:hypothetical protein
MSNTGLKVQDEALRELAFGAISSAYANLGTVTLFNADIVTITNNSDTDIYISFDGGTNTHKKLAAHTSTVYDYHTNDLFRIAGTQIAIKDNTVAATTGWVVAEIEYS